MKGFPEMLAQGVGCVRTLFLFLFFLLCSLHSDLASNG